MEFLASYLWEKRGSQTNSCLPKLNYSNHLSVNSYLLTYAKTNHSIPKLNTTPTH